MAVKNKSAAYYPLEPEEIAILERSGCSAESWDRVRVAHDFTPENIRNVSFSGDIRLGVFGSDVMLDGVFPAKSGIYNARLRNCEIGSGCFIENVGLISDYRIADDCVIRNTGKILTKGETAFGNGTEVSVVDETGGRKIPIYNKLSATLAYVAVFYRYNEDILKSVQHLVADYTASITTRQGYIGEQVFIENCGTIENVRICEYARVTDVPLLANGSLNSTSVSPVTVTNGVVAKDFIVSCGSELSYGAFLERCFVGEACRVSKGFTACDTLMFSNCRFENGEACSVFAGPFTVSVHKSTLMTGGLFSFFDAGAGCGQSNHLGKLGPVHHGIAERGVKFASGSHLLWPARIGAFSVVTGHVCSHPDTSDFPFSYLVGESGETYLMPGETLGSIGTLRDAEKWLQRDMRCSSEPADAISFEWLSPYTVSKMFAGRERLERLKHETEPRDGYYCTGGLKIPDSALESGIAFYTIAIRAFLGERMKRAGAEFAGSAEFCRWTDAAGLLAPEAEIKAFADFVCHEENLNITKVQKQISVIYAAADSWSDNWCASASAKEFGENFSADEIVKAGAEAKITLYKFMLADAGREFSDAAATGFGLDGDGADDTARDLAAVRGAVEENPLVCFLLEEIVKAENEIN